MKYLINVIAVFLLMTGFAVPIQADTVISFQEGISPTSEYLVGDTFMRSDQAGTAQGGTGYVYIGTNTTLKSFRGLYEFDISVIDALAGEQDVTINSVQLVLYAFQLTGGSLTIDLFQYNYDLNEATSTWNNPDGLGQDTTPGGTLGTFLTSGSVGAIGDVSFSDTTEFRTAVSGAIGSTDQTLRLILKDHNEGVGAKLDKFVVSEAASSAYRPELIVNFSIVPEPSMSTLLSCVVLAMFGLVWNGLKRGNS